MPELSLALRTTHTRQRPIKPFTMASDRSAKRRIRGATAGEKPREGRGIRDRGKLLSVHGGALGCAASARECGRLAGSKASRASQEAVAIAESTAIIKFSIKTRARFFRGS